MSARYTSPNGQPYLDLIFNIDGHSLTPLPSSTDSTKQFLAGISVKIKDEQDSIVSSSISKVLSPSYSNNVPEKFFMDLIRLNATSGINSIEISLLDLGLDSMPKETSFTEKVHIKAPGNYAAFLSDLLFISEIGNPIPGSPFNRNDRLMLPYLNDFFPTEMDKIIFYTEIYNSKMQFPGGQFAYSYQIVHPETHEVLFNLQKIKRAQASEVVPVVGSFNLTDVPNGKYLLQFEVRNTLNEVIVSQQKSFFRENSLYQPSLIEIEDIALANSFIGKVENDSLLNDYIASCYPIAGQNEKHIIIDPAKMLPDTKQKQRFFLQFWMNRNQTQPSIAWYEYKKEVDAVQEMFGNSIRRGYETDRGRVYLQYGKPSSRIERPSDPTAYPYEIWQYDNIAQFNNIRFVFYNPSVAINEYRLLHSDMRGEFRNPNWEMELQKRTTPTNSAIPVNPRGNFGINARDLYNNPR
ncbi:GWxTD domain-containing protein [Luteibaculum oceani]|nr:GWxTD domain-containing protein [Luteibaculum oceani]